MTDQPPAAPHPTEGQEARAADRADLARALAQVGRQVRAVVRGEAQATDHQVVRTEGGDDIFGVDARADQVLVAGLQALGARWPGLAVVEGLAEPVVIGGGGPWRYLADPVDGTRPYLAGKHSAWVLIGAGHQAQTLEDLEVGAAVEVPTDRAALGTVAWAVTGGPAGGPQVWAEDDDLVGEEPPRPVVLQPQHDRPLDRSFVTVVRLLPGSHGPIGAWADRHLAGLEVYDDLYPCTGAALMGLAAGRDRAVFDPRPLFAPEALAAHPYDLAALVVARAAGAVIEALPPGPLHVPLDNTTPVAWAGYADEATAGRLRPDDLGISDPVHGDVDG